MRESVTVYFDDVAYWFCDCEEFEKLLEENCTDESRALGHADGIEVDY